MQIYAKYMQICVKYANLCKKPNPIYTVVKVIIAQARSHVLANKTIKGKQLWKFISVSNSRSLGNIELPPLFENL